MTSAPSSAAAVSSVLSAVSPAAACSVWAADKLYISANAVTKQINLLESHLDVKLFHRST